MIFLVYTPLLILGLIVSLAGFTIGIPIVILIFIRGFFPYDGEITELGFFFSWYDLIIYLPGACIAFLFMKNAVIPITWRVFKEYVKFPKK